MNRLGFVIENVAHARLIGMAALSPLGSAHIGREAILVIDILGTSVDGVTGKTFRGRVSGGVGDRVLLVEHNVIDSTRGSLGRDGFVKSGSRLPFLFIGQRKRGSASRRNTMGRSGLVCNANEKRDDQSLFR